MRRLFVLLSFISIALCPAFAQESYSGPTDSWPYLFKSFKHGIVHFSDGQKDLEADLNICVGDGHLHYVDNTGTILESETKGVTGAEIDGKQYVAYGGEMMEVAASNENGFVVISKLVDPTQMGKADIGYGMTSSTYAASNLDLRAVTGLGQGLIHAKVAEAATNVGYGESLPLKEQYVIIVGKTKINADKKELQELVGKEATNEFLKTHKIKWTKPETMLDVINFIADNLESV